MPQSITHAPAAAPIGKKECIKKPVRPEDDAYKQKTDALQETSECWSKSFSNCISETAWSWLRMLKRQQPINRLPPRLQ